ncbi:hypothetical protein GCM10010919_19800 [Alishewanella longhuensis]|uniref:Anti-sigma factor n=1 Tax=Alishewanella longhuensis TaxID=1091037 RepID=A0ABQ3KYP3_9ALTE|nr:hypothetical protein [Alishewanella longhuensis]GHG69693.1 hypothetical protein GCM10010919_19800 [Alishewanella longhuensis]
MSEHKHEQTRFEQQLQRAYQQSKANYPMPKKIRQQILQQADSSKRFSYQNWFRNAQLVLGSIFLTVLGYLMLQPVSISSYQIVVTYTDNATKIESHSLTVRSLPAVVAQFSVDENQQRYQQMLLAQHRINQFHAELGVLHRGQQHWQITMCNHQVVSIDEALLQQLKIYDTQLAQWQLEQSIEVYRGPQGQILAIKPAAQEQQCPLS